MALKEKENLHMRHQPQRKLTIRNLVVLSSFLIIILLVLLSWQIISANSSISVTEARIAELEIELDSTRIINENLDSQLAQTRADNAGLQEYNTALQEALEVWQAAQGDDADNIITVTVPFYIPPLDLRGYELNHFEIQEWFLEHINQHRAAEGIHGYEFYTPAIVTSIEHSLDMRDNNFGRNAASDGRTHQQRHHRWLGYARTRVTSAHSSSHAVSEGSLTPDCVAEIVDRIMNVEQSRVFLLNPTYYYIGIGFSIQENAMGRLSVTMATPEGEREAHHARSQAERAEHRERYLEMVRERTGWTPDE